MTEKRIEFDATPDTLPVGGGAPVVSTGRSAPRRFVTPLMAFGVFLAIVLIGVAVVFSFWRRPFYALAPGSVRDASQRISVADVESYVPEGEVGFVTVSLTERVSMWEYLSAKVDDSVDLVHEDIINGDRTADEKREEDRRRMQDSKNDAAVVALEYLGYTVPWVGLGVEVANTTPCMPADGVLNTGDLIIGVDGTDVLLTEELIGELADNAPGDSVLLTVDRIEDGTIEDVDLELGSSAAECLPADIRDSEDEAKARIGIGLGPQLLEYELPVDVEIETDRVGGPSAGLAFTLAIIDVLTPGELTGGLSVATTGTITPTGVVGRVGGVKQKTVAARESGTDLFLVPADELDEALGFAGDMEVRAVATLDDAMAALDSFGGNGLNIERNGELATD